MHGGQARLEKRARSGGIRSDAEDERSPSRGRGPWWKPRTGTYAGQTHPRKGWDRGLEHAVVGSENQPRAGSGSRERGRGASCRAAMTVAVMRDGTGKSSAKVARGLLG